MRRFLLTIACFIVGLMTVSLVVALFMGDTSVTVGFLVLWCAALVVGIALSAPFFLSPPEYRGDGYWSLPVSLWIIAQLVKLIDWVGWTVLRGSWFLLHLAIPGGRDRDPDVDAVPLAGPMATAAIATTASWLPDPTGRYQLRYWDGTQWTDHVSTNGVQATDSI